jgi:hypothetical protein
MVAHKEDELFGQEVLATALLEAVKDSLELLS